MKVVKLIVLTLWNMQLLIYNHSLLTRETEQVRGSYGTMASPRPSEEHICLSKN